MDYKMIAKVYSLIAELEKIKVDIEILKIDCPDISELFQEKADHINGIVLDLQKLGY